MFTPKLVAVKPLFLAPVNAALTAYLSMMTTMNKSLNKFKLMLLATVIVACTPASAQDITPIASMCREAVSIGEIARLRQRNGEDAVEVLLSLRTEDKLANWVLGSIIPYQTLTFDPQPTRINRAMFRCVGAYYEFKQNESSK